MPNASRREGPTPLETSTPNSRRRRFLLTLGLTSAGAAATAAVPAVRAQVANAVEDATQGSGYRETEHVRNYYDSARI